jgi:hypothetical protein
VGAGCLTTRVLTPAPATSTCPDILAPSLPGGVPVWKGELLKIGKVTRDHYCDYTLTFAGSPRVVDVASLNALAASRPGTELACPIVVPLAGGDEPASMPVSTTEDLEHYYGDLLIESVGRPPRAPSGVRIAVVDTAAVPYDAACAPDRCDRNAHGRAVGRTIAELVCPDETRARPCAAIRNHLGLPVVSTRAASLPDRVRGGHLGTQFDLARGINEAVDSWASIHAAKRPRLIINLSVGWHSVHHSVAPENLRTIADPEAYLVTGQLGVRGRGMVRRAIERARCLGALVITAAGNAIGADRAGPLYPAAWEQEPLARSGCGAFGGSTVSEGAEPLVYAVSAVDHAGRLLSNTRSPGGVARRAALGLMVGAPELRGVEPNTPFYTGTSMAAAVVSAVAASLWSELPGASAREVMLELDRRLHLPPTPRPVDLCLRAAGRPSDSTPCDPPVSYGVANFCARAEGCGGAIARLPPTSEVRPIHPERGSLCAVPGPRGSCNTASEAHYLFEPWVAPQPTDPGCSGRCTLFLTSAEARIYLQRREAARAVRADLYASARSLTALASLDLAATAFDPGSEAVVSFARTGVFDSATVTFEILAGDGRVMASEHPLPVLELME